MPGFVCSGPGGAWARAGDASARIAAAAAINAAKPAVLGKLKLIEVFYLIPDVAPGVACIERASSRDGNRAQYAAGAFRPTVLK